ncbi:MAG: hypothetical protein E6G49_02385 [Actinobacteria bacterium]|jgi:hypothetical protein|nr:MAG: hypothetical protein E6G49_02385 [Actinomycetota bacterium]
MKNVKPPQFLGNLFRDMRDRHLLLPALALVIGMLAVPILLKSHNDAHSAAPASENGGTQANSATPAVVREEMGVTDYKKRLNRLKTKNPFHQQYTAPPPDAQAQASASAALPSTSGSSAPPPTGGTSAAPPASTAPPSVSASPPTPSTTTSSQPTKPTFHLYTFRVSVKVGEANDLKDRNQVSSLALLPSKHKPILSFLEANGKQALFLVSTDVNSVSGDGRCVPRPKDCQYIIMRPGDKAHFDYAPDGKRYNLVLVNIHAVEIGHKPPTDVLSKSASTGPVDLKQKLPLLGDG